MNTVSALIYGIVGLIIGFKVPNISYKIMEYKKGKDNTAIKNNFLNYKYVAFLLSLFNGIAWFLSAYHKVGGLYASLIAVQITLALIIAHIDINIRIIPNELVLTIIVLGILYQTIFFGLYGIIGSVMSMIFIMVVFTAVAGFMGFGKVGAGDVKFAGAIGLSLGYPLITTAMGTMAIVLFVFIIIGLLFKKIQMSTMLPLGPFLSAGYLIALLTVIV